MSSPTQRQRHDPTFKRLGEKAISDFHLNLKNPEFKIQRLSSPDLFLEIPPGISVKGTPFDFCRRYSIIEFKSYNDPLTIDKMENQLARVHWWSKENKEVGPQNILNVIISARYPQNFLKLCEEEWGTKFSAKRKGILEGRSLFQNITIVVCEQLPIIPQYAIWLLFADPTTNTWRETVRMLARKRLLDLLLEAMRINQKEYEAMSTEIEEILEQYSPEEREKYMDEIAELAKFELKRLSPERIPSVLSVLTPEERLQGLAPEQRLQGLAPEQEEELLKKLQQKFSQKNKQQDDKQ